MNVRRDARTLAATVVQRVIEEGAFSQLALAAELSRADLPPRERRLAALLTYGTLTWLRPIDAALDALLARGIGSIAPPVRCILRVAAYQIVHLRGSIPEFAAVNEAVDAVRATSGPRLAAMANGVLRNLARRGPDLVQPPDAPLARFGLIHSVPDWIAASLLGVLSESEAGDAMTAFNDVTPVHLRIRDGDPDALVTELSEAGLDATRHPFVPTALRVRGADPASTEAFRRGAVSIQDAGAQWATDLLPADLDGPVLDACAGIGGKAIQILDRSPRATVVATDLHRRKLDVALRTASNDRLRAHAWDLTEEPPRAVAEAGPFEAILLDAPCSALGTIGRHPEVRWNRQPADVDTLAVLQRRMLDAVVPLLRPGGWLVYAVCTWTDEEGPAQIADLLRRHPTLHLSPHGAVATDAAWSVADTEDTGRGWRLWPHRNHTGAFFAARLRRGGA